MPGFRVPAEVFGLLSTITLIVLILVGCNDSKDVPATAEPTTDGGFTDAHMFGGETVEVWVYGDAQPDAEFCSEIVNLMVPVDATAAIPGKPTTCIVKGPEATHLLVVRDNSGVLHLAGIKLVLLGENELSTRSSSDSSRSCDDLEPNLLGESDDPNAAVWQAECQLQVPPKGTPQSSSRVVWASVPASTEVPVGQTLPCWLVPRYMQSPGGAKFVKCFL